MTDTLFQQPANGTVRPPTTGAAAQWAWDVVETIRHASAAAPRSQQAVIGPSEAGTPCNRKLGYRLLNWPKVNTTSDPWPSTVGTAIHAALAGMYETRNALIGRERYLIERTVRLPGGMTGHCDLYDRDLRDVVDWKTTSTSSHAGYVKNGPGEQYRIQAHLYGLGMQLAGEQPENVVIVFLPRSSRLSDLHVWSEPYDYRVAVKALERINQLEQFHVTIDPEQHPDRWAWLTTADSHCGWCPWFLPGSTNLSRGCPGHNTT